MALMNDRTASTQWLFIEISLSVCDLSPPSIPLPNSLQVLCALICSLESSPPILSTRVLTLSPP